MKLFRSNLEVEDTWAADAVALEKAVNGEGFAPLAVFKTLLSFVEAIEEDFTPRVAFIDLPEDTEALDEFVEEALEPGLFEEDLARLAGFIALLRLEEASDEDFIPREAFIPFLDVAAGEFLVEADFFWGAII